MSPLPRPVIRLARAAPRAATASSRHSFHPLLRRFATASSSGLRQQQQQQQHPAAAAGDNHVRLVEVGPRDGLQNEKKAIPVETKIELVERLAAAGLRHIEAGSFVSPRWVPQMASSDAVMEHLLVGGGSRNNNNNNNNSSSKGPAASSPPPHAQPITYSFLAPNEKGLAGAQAVLARHPGAYLTQAEAIGGGQDTSSGGGGGGKKPALELAVFAAATESFSRRNLNCDIATSLERFRPVIAGAKAAGLRARAYVSVVLGCPFEGPEGADPHRVAEIATSLLEMGADEIALGDTTGMGTAPRTDALLRCVVGAAGVRAEDVAMHFHDTYGQALVNTAVALERGIRSFDCAVGGLGGCPYSPGATGNVATEDVVYFLESLGMSTGVDLDAVADVGGWISRELGRAHDSSVGRAVLGARRAAEAEAEAGKQ